MGDYTKEDLIAAMDDIMLAVIDGQPIPTNTVDRLPPWRARLTVRMAMLGGAVLQDGTAEQFEQAAAEAGRRDARQVGWWRASLGMPPRPELTPEPAYAPPAGPPRGWTYASGEGETRTREGR